MQDNKTAKPTNCGRNINLYLNEKSLQTYMRQSETESLSDSNNQTIWKKPIRC